MENGYTNHKIIACILGICLLFTGLPAAAADGDGEGEKNYPITPVAFNQVRVCDSFWGKRIETNRKVTIPIAFHHCETTGRINNFKIAGGLMKGKFQSDAPFDDSDVSKIIEGAAYSLASYPDKTLEAYTDSVIYYMSRAQEPDGYLYTYRTIMGNGSHDWIGNKRWEKVHEMSHELYNLGHMYEAGVAYYQATGKRNLLDVCIKSANLLCHDFGPNALHSYPGHQEVEIGLVKLYRVTGEKKYLDLAKFFLDMRGRCAWEGTTYNQSHKPVVEQEEAVGHSVRALYMFTGMADVAAMTGDHSYVEAIDRLWDDIVKTKLYITGGVGAAGGHEGFGGKYELPNASAYCETCAAIANVFWNQRMFLMTGDAKYIDVLERALYNNVLSGVAVSGDRFFYPNRLESVTGASRSEWFGCACCPSNISRLIPNVPGYIYATKGNNLYVNLFMDDSVKLDMEGTEVEMIQRGGMPYEGNMELTVNPKKKADFNLKIRIPGWARNEAVPGNELYRFQEDSPVQTVVKVNGITVPMLLDKGYLTLARKWQKGDKVSILFPMEVRRVVSHYNVEADRGKVALQRGPLVYCAEGKDVESGGLLDLVLDNNEPVGCKWENLPMGRMMVLSSRAHHTQRQLDGTVAMDSSTVGFKCIPYFAWAQRGASSMMIWFATNKGVARPMAAPTPAHNAKVASSIEGAYMEAIRDQILPARSQDNSCDFFHWWPRMNSTEWITYTFDKPLTLSRTQVYWFSDNGGCKEPKAWRILYKKGNEWLPVKAKGEFSTALDKLNTTEFEPVTTEAVKMEVDTRQDASTGLYEWNIE